MEDSMNSMIRKTLSSDARTTADNDHDESPEESSWTMYLEDFLINNHHADGHREHSNSAFSSGYYDDQSHSIISDAASSVTNKLSNTKNEEVLGFGSMVKISGKRSSFSKRKSKEALFDDALEDTASSPVNSPKLCNKRQPSDMKPELRKDDIEMITLEKGSPSGHVDERSDELGFNGMENDCTEVTELKKRGLCLVPFSMVANYFG